jgi:hypothetical protein
VFAIVTQWLGDINRFSTIFNDLSSFMFLRIQILAKFSTFMLTAFCYKEAENMEWGEGNKQIQAAKCDPFAA